MKLTHFAACAVAVFTLVEVARGAPVTLQQATATFHQGNFGNKDQTIDGSAAGGNGMGFFNARFAATNIAWETASDVTGPGTWTFTLDSNLGGAHSLQHFRLSATDAPRAAFADNNPPNGSEAPAGDVLSAPGNWYVLNPISVTSSNGASMTVGPNGRITASGAIPATDTYTITAQSPIGNITGLRLEALPGGNGAVGFAGNGNATISEFSADFVSGGEIAPAGQTFQVNLQNATASFDQGGQFTIGTTIDGVAHGNNGWGIFGQQSTAQTAVFQTDVPIDTNRLVFEIDQTSPFGAHKLQEFRLSFTTDANPTESDGSINWTQITPTSASTSLATSDAAINLATDIVSITGADGVPDIYQIVADADFQGVTGFRLEALLGSNNLVGFSTGGGNGNIVLSEFNVFAQTQAAPVPEPASVAIWSLIGLGLAGFGFNRIRRKK